jgi:hypothetical protein
MIENLIYPVIGFGGTLLGLETAWHFAACRLKNKTITPCLFRRLKTVMPAGRRYIT